ncbi:LysR substrate-binding domain-containing protein [Agrobacterium tumefaciens]|uniref:LysR substrate-binding domain-containing protein n=1 Tax=Agrobacterium tumefaciens TaxID=358 RepID=UPI002242E9A3|nr:LysR substrate-binding domain-containing protein [Agrobacterium tumefaciens]MCW8143085.1 LysR substrate-binding domain-containing protein [Agrobacterium tumefaciens]
MPRPNVRQIEAFNAVMKGGSVTKAAEALFISQPALTKLIQAFEHSCGFKLFSRDTGRLLPTPEAHQLFVETERLEIGVERVQKTANAIRDLERGEISVAVFPSLGLQFLPRLVAKFLSARPGVIVSQVTRPSRTIDDAVVTRVADFGLTLVKSGSAAVRCEPFQSIHMACVLPTGHRLAAKQVIEYRDLDGERFIALGREDLSQQLVQAALDAEGVNVDVTAEVQLAQAAIAMVSAGCGISIGSPVSLLGLADENVVFRPLRTPIMLPVWLITPRFSEPSTICRRLIDDIRASLEALCEGYAIPAKI